jgi:geranylgeranyl pyrophosphate synthase
MLQIEDYQKEASDISEAQHAVLASYRAEYGVNSLLEIGNYALAETGKMMRGMLLLESCRAVGGNPENVLFAAAGIEDGHLASLIHDDLIDHDEIRRGQSTIWKAYGDDAAILSGDVFIFSAFHSLSLCRHHIEGDRVARAFEVLSLASVELCLGQASEALLVGKCSTQVQEYLAMIRQKTGSLIRASVETGAVLGGASEKQLQALREYGDSLGLAFQIVDDILPYISQTQTLRKPTKSDIKNRRITLPIIFALKESNESEREILRQIFEEGYLADALDEAQTVVTHILEQTGALERARQETLNYQRRAQAALAILPENDGRTFLADFAELVVRRLY